MYSMPALAARLGVALGIGLLIGAERERHKRMAKHPVAAGVRTITLVALIGAVGGLLATTLGGVAGSLLLIGVTGAVTALVVAGHRREDSGEPAMTTEVAVLLTLLLGALSMYQPLAAAALGVIVAIVLLARTQMHRFVTNVLSEQELQDALVLLAATLVVLPLLPSRPIDPFGAFTPSQVWTVAVVVMGIGAAGHIARRTLGTTYGLPIVGLATGFVSSIAAIGAMGAEARNHPERERAAVAGAALSTLSTIVQLTVIVALADVAVLGQLLAALVSAGIVAAAYGAAFTLSAAKGPELAEATPGRAFDPRIAIAFAATLSAMLFTVAVIRRYLGSGAVLGATVLGGLADAHSTAYSVVSLAAHGGVPLRTAALGVLLALTANTITKAVTCVAAGGRRFFVRVAPGLALVIAATWIGAWAGGLI